MDLMKWTVKERRKMRQLLIELGCVNGGGITCFVVKKVLGDGAPVYNDVAGRETHRIPEGFG